MISSISIPKIQARRKMRIKRGHHITPSAKTVLLLLLVIFLVSFTIFTNSSNIPKSLRGGGVGNGAKKSDIWVTTNAQNFNENGILNKATHLIMVAGHSVIVSGHLQDAGIDEKDWYLLDYQKGRGLPQAIIAHIQEGIKLASLDKQSLLIFSGGETRPATGPSNEGSSYFHVADAMHLWESDVRSRTTAEEFATDSYQNLLFSICRFKEVTGHYPTKITVVSFSFKERRFEQLHATALRWPEDHFHYVGIDPDESTGFDLNVSSEGEQTNSVVPFESDPYGCNSEMLQKKRIDRNPFSRTPPYELTCKEMKVLLQWCGPELIPTSEVPW